MDFFQGSIPPNFISFHLKNQTTEVANTPADPSAIASTVSPPTDMGPQVQDPSTSQETTRNRADDVISTHSADSDPDVTTYAESMVRQLESAQTLSQLQEDATQAEPIQDTAQVSRRIFLLRLQQRTGGRAHHF